MAFVAASSPKVPANRQYPVASRASGDGPDTAQYGLVWPNEWPNGEIHARDDERARGARDGRDRSYRHGVGGSSKQHERTGVTAGALSGQLAASSPAGLAAANDLTIPIYHRPARGRRAPAREARALAGSPSLTRSSTRVASGTSDVVPATAAVIEAAVSTEPTRARSALPIVRGPLVIGAGPSVRPIHGSDETIVSGG
jgi:hypothetical protein